MTGWVICLHIWALLRLINGCMNWLCWSVLRKQELTNKPIWQWWPLNRHTHGKKRLCLISCVVTMCFIYLTLLHEAVTPSFLQIRVNEMVVWLTHYSSTQKAMQFIHEPSRYPDCNSRIRIRKEQSSRDSFFPITPKQWTVLLSWTSECSQVMIVLYEHRHANIKWTLLKISKQHQVFVCIKSYTV